MLKLRKGCKVSHPELLSEGYAYDGSFYIANVDADKIEDLLAHFIVMHDEPIFFILELPASLDDETELRPGVLESLHRDVYYIDGCTREEALAILGRTSEILINDGMCDFGFGCHESQDEIMVGKYNVVSVYTHSRERFQNFFEEHKIPCVDKLVTAWDTFTQDAPGEASRVYTKGKSCFDVPEMFKDWGIYHAEQREE